MFIKVQENGNVVFPYTRDDLRKDNPHVGFPERLSAGLLKRYGVFTVHVKTPPTVDVFCEYCSESLPPKFEDGIWQLGWEVKQFPNDVAEANVRGERNRRLSATDWRFRSDLTPSQAWVDYCQALRDITAQETFPQSVVWPTEPE